MAASAVRSDLQPETTLDIAAAMNQLLADAAE